MYKVAIVVWICLLCDRANSRRLYFCFNVNNINNTEISSLRLVDFSSLLSTVM